MATDFDGTFYLNNEDIINNVKNVNRFINAGNIVAIAKIANIGKIDSKDVIVIGDSYNDKKI